ncbi:hypothetical protein KEG38_43250 [Polyangium jinanense]|uniref:hypothetical protein n=1 Tax=Polyangium jinanense TaxID=2829994 RepID=UPI00233FBEBA|nr:hypothetical protein [Polyangium jinanense]MDC3960749.1 hypothetical protein [Polyangium jinanense]
MTAPECRADEAPHYRIEFSADPKLPACDRASSFEAMLDSHVSEDVLEPPASRVLVMHIGRTSSGTYTADVRIESLEGTTIGEPQHLEYPSAVSCFEVLYNAAFISATQMGAFKPPKSKRDGAPLVHCPEEQPAPAAPPPNAVRKAAPSTTRVTGATRPAVLEPRASRTMRVQVGLGGMFSLGMAPEALGGIQAGVVARWPKLWSVELDARWTPAVETRPIGPTIVEVTTMSAVAAPCFRPDPFAFCGLLVVGWRQESTVNVIDPNGGGVPVLGSGARVAAESPPLASRFTLRFDADVVVSGAHWRSTTRRFDFGAPGPVSVTFGAWLFASL